MNFDLLKAFSAKSKQLKTVNPVEPLANRRWVITAKGIHPDMHRLGIKVLQPSHVVRFILEGGDEHT